MFKNTSNSSWMRIKNNYFQKYDWLKWVSWCFVGLTVLLITLVGLFLVVFSIPFFKSEQFHTFFRTNWNPTNNSYGIINFIISTFWTVFLTMILVVIFNIFTSVFISKFLPLKFKKGIVFLFQMLSGVPSVLFGMFGAFVITKLLKDFGVIQTKSMFLAIVVLTSMVLPTTVVLTVNILDNVPQKYEFAAYSLGVNKTVTIFDIIRKHFSRKILLVLFYGFCRAIGEVTAISLIAGNGPNAPPLSAGFEGFFFHSITTLSSLIGLEIGETINPIHHSALYGVGLVLIVIVFLANLFLFLIIKIKSAPTLKGWSSFLSFNKVNQKTPWLWQWLRTQFAKFKMWFQRIMMFICFSLVMSLFLWILGDVVINGIRYFDFGRLVVVDGEAALLSVIIATIILIIGSIIITFPFAFFVAIFLSEYNHLNRWINRFCHGLYFVIRQLSSSPTIIFGIFGLSIFVVFFNLGFSILAASLTMILILLPLMIQTLVQNLRSVPNYYRYSAQALGLKRSIIIWYLIVPYVAQGIIISIILAINKVISESAPLLVTMGTTANLPRRGIFSSGRSLTTHIYLLQSENLSVNSEAITYQTAFITLMFILLLNGLIYFLTAKSREKKIEL